MTREEFVAEVRRLTEDMDDYDVAVMIEMSVPTIRRWKSGQNVPLKMMRKGVIDRLKKEIAEDQA